MAYLLDAHVEHSNASGDPRRREIQAVLHSRRARTHNGTYR